MHELNVHSKINNINLETANCEFPFLVDFKGK